MKYSDERDHTKSKICKTCGNIFYKKKCVSIKKWEKQKFCSWNCRKPKKYSRKYKAQAVKNVTYIIQCKYCKKFFFVKSLYLFKKQKFCSHSCSMKYRIDTGEIKKAWTEERRNRKRVKQKKLAEKGLWKNPILMPGIIDKIKNTKAKNPRKFSDEEIEECSKRAAERIINRTNINLGNFKFGKIGYYYSTKLCKNILYRSSFEKKAFEILDTRQDVSTYVTEPFHIEYKLNNIKHYYIPDILVTYTDGSKQLIEVKPLAKLNEEKTILKSEAAIKYCRDKKIDRGYIIWTEIVLFPNRNLNGDLNDRL